VTYSSNVTLTADRVLTEAAGIDLSTAVAGQIRVNVDLTELTNQTWGAGEASSTQTYNVSGTTDPVWTYTDGSANLSAGTLYQAGGKVALGIATATDNRLVRWDSTGGQQLQTSAITVDDTGNVSGMGTLGVGAVTGGTYNKVTVTAPGTGATLTLADGSSLITVGGYSTTLTASNTTALTLPTTGTLQTTTGTPAGFVITSQATGDLLYASSGTAWSRLGIQAAGYVLAGGATPAWSSGPQITTIELGAATDTTIARSAAGIITVEGSYVAFNPATTIGDMLYATSTATPSALGRLVDVAAGQPLLSGGVGAAPAYAGYTFSATGAATYTFPGATSTLARTDAGQTFTGVQAFTAPTVATSIAPASADGATLGTTALEFSDLYLADGGVIYFQNDQSVYLTPSAATLTLTGAFATTTTLKAGTDLTIAGGDITVDGTEEVLTLADVASATNNISISNAANSASPSITVIGSSDSNIGIIIDAKGTGEIVIGSADAKFSVASDALDISNTGAVSGVTSLTFVGANASPDAAGEIQYDSTIA
jgi:hypothetical protein